MSLATRSLAMSLVVRMCVVGTKLEQLGSTHGAVTCMIPPLVTASCLSGPSLPVSVVVILVAASCLSGTRNQEYRHPRQHRATLAPQTLRGGQHFPSKVLDG